MYLLSSHQSLVKVLLFAQWQAKTYLRYSVRTITLALVALMSMWTPTVIPLLIQVLVLALAEVSEMDRVLTFARPLTRNKEVFQMMLA